MLQKTDSFRALDLAYIALFAVLICICSWIAIPFAVPVTLQTFAVFLALMTLGPRRGFYAVAVYLLMGAVGLPVFSGFQGGIGVLLGAGGGYLIGFLIAALLCRLLLSRVRSVSAACLPGLLVCHLCGILWFCFMYAPQSAARPFTGAGWYLLLYILPDLIKLQLASMLSKRLRKYLK